jgi:hypothetical protein
MALCLAGGFAVGGRGLGGWAEDDAGSAVEDATDGPTTFGCGEKDLAGALLLRAVVPAAEE